MKAAVGIKLVSKVGDGVCKAVGVGKTVGLVPFGVGAIVGSTLGSFRVGSKLGAVLGRSPGSILAVGGSVIAAVGIGLGLGSKVADGVCKELGVIVGMGVGATATSAG